MEFPRQPQPVKITISGSHAEDVSRAFYLIRQILDNHYASINTYDITEDRVAGRVIDCYPFAVND